MGATKTVTDATFADDVLHVRQARARRLLGRVVRSVQDGRARSSRRSPREHATRSRSSSSTSTRTRRPPRAERIMSIPTMNVYQGGQVVKQIVGAKPKAALLADLAEFL